MDGTFIVIGQHYVQDLLTTTAIKSMGQGKKKNSMFTQEIVWCCDGHSKGELSFVVDGVNLSVAFDGIPLDKPLVPCVLLWYEYYSVELDFPE